MWGFDSSNPIIIKYNYLSKMSRDPKQYFRQSARLKNHDYSKGDAYFVTVTVDGEGEIFGKVVEGKVKLNKAGEIIEKVWMNLPKQFTNVKLDEFVIMPDHFHGIIILENKKEGLMNQARTKEKIWILMKNKKNTLGKVIRAFKAKVTRLIHEDGSNDFKWHRNYYDRIVRNEKDLLIIRKYIKNNPLNLKIAKNNKNNL
jgi:putative transposase